MALQLRPEAREDLDTAAHWYEAQEKGLGRQFLAEVRMVFQRIRANPDTYPVTYRGTRRALIRRFPYGVIYLQLPQQDCIVVLAVLLGLPLGEQIIQELSKPDEPPAPAFFAEGHLRANPRGSPPAALGADQIGGPPGIAQHLQQLAAILKGL